MVQEQGRLYRLIFDDVLAALYPLSAVFVEAFREAELFFRSRTYRVDGVFNVVLLRVHNLVPQTLFNFMVRRQRSRRDLGQFRIRHGATSRRAVRKCKDAPGVLANLENSSDYVCKLGVNVNNGDDGTRSVALGPAQMTICRFPAKTITVHKYLKVQNPPWHVPTG